MLTKAIMFKRMFDVFRDSNGKARVPQKLISAWFDQVTHAVRLTVNSRYECDGPQGWRFNDGSAVIIENLCQMSGNTTIHLR